jgi:GDPmannose 4,6-dehydratase
MQWLMLQQDSPEDYVIATGVQYSVRQFVERSAAELGITLDFEGEGVGEIARVRSVQPVGGELLATCQPGSVVVRVDPRYFRPTEVETLLGDASKARNKLGWTPATSFESLVQEMVQSDFNAARRDRLVMDSGYAVPRFHE